MSNNKNFTTASKIRGDVFRHTVYQIDIENSIPIDGCPIKIDWLYGSNKYKYPINRIQLNNETKQSTRAILRAFALKATILRLNEKRCVPNDFVVIEVGKLRKKDGIVKAFLPEHFEPTGESDGFYRLTFSGNIQKITASSKQCADCGNVHCSPKCDICVQDVKILQREERQIQNQLRSESVSESFGRIGTVLIVQKKQRPSQAREVEEADGSSDIHKLLQYASVRYNK